MRNGRVLVGTVLTACLLTLGGCIVSIKSEEGATGPTYDGNSTSKVKLSHDERECLPKVQTTADLPTVRSTYADELSKLGPNTTLEQFQALFPQAKFVERREANGSKFDAYSIRVEKKFRYRDESYGYMARDEKWFFFRDGVFIKWSSPKEWPEVVGAA
jgi:hypothetical protein